MQISSETILLLIYGFDDVTGCFSSIGEYCGEPYTNELINKKQEFDIRGYYTINSDEFENELVVIKGRKTKPKTTLFLLDSLSLPTSFEGNTISINTKNGNFRSVGIFSDGKIKGRYQDETGIFHHFSMVRDSLYEEKEKELKVETDSIIPKIWMPNKSYGFIQNPTTEIIIFKNATVF